MEKHDVVVVGAGPAGLEVAKNLVAHGKDTLVLERNKELMKKPCGGGLTYWAREQNIVPKDFFEKEFYYIKFRTPNHTHFINTKKPFITTYSRKKFGEYLCDAIEKNGGEVRTNKKVTKVNKEEKYVKCTDGEDIGYNYLIGADGAASVVRTSLGLGVKHMLCFQYTSTKELPAMEWGADVNTFYGSGYWIFPHRGYTLVGIGFLPKKYGGSGGPRPEEFRQYWEKEGIELEEESYESAPIGIDYQGFKFGNIYLIGDAGGFGQAWSGEGDYEAFKTAEIAANSILNPHFDSNPSLNALLRYKKSRDRLLYSMYDTYKVLPEYFGIRGKIGNFGLDLISASFHIPFIRRLLGPSQDGIGDFFE